MKVGILGGGVMGLTLAWRLIGGGHKVTVIEAAPQIGGLATWASYDQFVWDKFYHVICASDEYLLGLIRELGLEEKVRWNRTKTGFLWRGRHISMSNNWELLTFPALTLLDKARLAAGILYCQRVDDPSALERISAPEWLCRVFGKSVYRAIWEPLLESKYGVLKDQMPATIMWATIRRYYATREKKGGRELMGFISGGYKTLLEAIDRAITRAGGEIHCGAPVAALEESAAEGEPVTVRTAAGRAFEFDRVISTLPTAVLERVGPGVAWREARTGARPRFLGVVCLALVLRRPLNPYYVTNLIQKGFPFTGIIGVSNLTGPEELGGWHLAVLPRYDIPASPYFERGRDELAGEFTEALRPIWPDIQQNVVSCHVNRERMVQALWIDSPPPPLHGPARSASGRIWSVNAELTGRDTLNNNAIIRVAGQAAVEFLRDSGGPEPAGLAPVCLQNDLANLDGE